MVSINTTRREKHYTYVALPIVLAVSCAVFAPALFGYFHADDWFHLYTPVNAQWWRTFSGDWFTGMSGQGGLYRPLIRVSIVVDKALYGNNASGFHATNILLHMVNVWLLTCIARALFSSRNDRVYVLLAGLLFGVFPLHHQAVYWISGRTDLLATTFSLAALLMLLKGLREPRSLYYGLFIIFTIAGLLSKELAIAVPPLALVALVLFGIHQGSAGEGVHANNEQSKNRRHLYCAMFMGLIVVVVAGYLICRSLIIGALPAGKIMSISSLMTTYTSFFAFLYKPWQVVVPDASLLNMLIYLIPPVAAMALAQRSRFKQHLFVFLWIIITILPMSGFSVTPHDGQRLLYLPAAGWFLFWTFTVRHIFTTERLKRHTRKTLLLYPLLLFMLGAGYSVSGFIESLDWLRYSRRTRGIVQQSLPALRTLDSRTEQFTVAIVNKAPQPRVEILAPHNSLNAALRVLGERDWNIDMYFQPEHRAETTWALVIDESFSAQVYPVDNIDVLHWDASDISASWDIPAGVETGTITSSDAGVNPLLRLQGKRLLINSPVLDRSGWLLLSLYYRLDNESMGEVTCKIRKGSGEIFITREYPLFNDVGKRFEYRNVPLQYVSDLHRINIAFASHPGIVEIGEITLRRFSPADAPVQ